MASARNAITPVICWPSEFKFEKALVKHVQVRVQSHTESPAVPALALLFISGRLHTACDLLNAFSLSRVTNTSSSFLQPRQRHTLLHLPLSATALVSVALRLPADHASLSFIYLTLLSTVSTFQPCVNFHVVLTAIHRIPQ